MGTVDGGPAGYIDWVENDGLGGYTPGDYVIYTRYLDT